MGLGTMQPSSSGFALPRKSQTFLSLEKPRMLPDPVGYVRSFTCNRLQISLFQPYIATYSSSCAFSFFSIKKTPPLA